MWSQFDITVKDSFSIFNGVLLSYLATVEWWPGYCVCRFWFTPCGGGGGGLRGRRHGLGCMPAGPSALLGFRGKVGWGRDRICVCERQRQRGRPADNPNWSPPPQFPLHPSRVHGRPRGQRMWCLYSWKRSNGAGVMTEISSMSWMVVEPTRLDKAFLYCNKLERLEVEASMWGSISFVMAFRSLRYPRLCMDARIKVQGKHPNCNDQASVQFKSFSYSYNQSFESRQTDKVILFCRKDSF